MGGGGISGVGNSEHWVLLRLGNGGKSGVGKLVQDAIGSGVFGAANTPGDAVLVASMDALPPGAPLSPKGVRDSWFPKKIELDFKKNHRIHNTK